MTGSSRYYWPCCGPLPGSKPEPPRDVRQAMDDAHVTGLRLAGAQEAQAKAKADAELLDAIRAAGCPGWPFGNPTFCLWCGQSKRNHMPDCLWLRIEAR